jgi:glycosyltransferase involved in cell wall biosynthesis
VILAEEWQTASAVIRLNALLRERGLDGRVATFWNANNPYGFERLDWPALAAATQPLTVSRFMRAILRTRGVDSIVLPNGLPARLIGNEPDRLVLRRLGHKRRRRTIFFKMARWEREKGWCEALDAMTELRRRGQPATLIARAGGSAGRGEALAGSAALRGLEVVDLPQVEGQPAQQLETITAPKADVVNLRFPVTEPLARLLFAGSDGVLANSIMEPFGLVGLEAMAAGGVVFTGGTGEDYAVDDLNAVVLQSTDPAEIVDRAEALRASPDHETALRTEAKRTARGYTWDATIDRLLALAQRQERRG